MRADLETGPTHDGATRRRLVGVAVALCAVGAVVARAWPGDGAVELRTALDGARAFADSLERTPGDSSPGALVARGYLVRQREGLGSPFRLIELARSDPRLSPAARARLATALLARTAEADPLPPSAAGALAVAATSDSAAAGRALAGTIARLVLDDDGPETLEALRIAALVAGAEGTLHPRAVPLVGATAVLVRDRLRARADAERLLDEARRLDGDALALVAARRAARRLDAERPALAEPAPDPRRVATRVRALARRLADAAARGAAGRAPAPAPHAHGVAGALASLASVRTRPPQPQVRLALQDAQSLVRSVRGDDGGGAARRLLAAAHEEGVVAALAAARADTLTAPAADVATLLVAQGMRTLAQEAAWHPGMPLPAPEAVAAQLGLASLRFGADVPAAWRPWYARELAYAISSLRTVFPWASVTGLRVRIGGDVGPDALAVHDPRTRTLVLPIGTGFGAIGHELLHDVDWQAARDQLRRRGSYATDAAVRGGRRDSLPLAAPLVRLAALAAPATPGRPATPAAIRRAAEAQRPAELLARGGDWYLAATLARAGRSDGALTSVQDAWVPGYASATRPDPFGAREAALAALLDAMPALALRSTPSASPVGALADLGALARLAWMLPVPAGPVAAVARPLGEAPTTTGVLQPWTRATAGRCSPLEQARLLPVRAEAIALADALIRPRVATALRRWADTPAPADEPEPHRQLRQALLGGPVGEDVVDRAIDLAVVAVRGAIPCLGALPPGLGAAALR